VEKDDKAPAWAVATGVGILACLFASLALVAAGGWTWFAGFLISSASGWVQAFGSIGAIAVAIWLVGKQAHNDRERAREDAESDRRRYLEVALELVSAVAQVSKKISVVDFGHNAETFNAMKAEVGTLVDALGLLDVARLDGHVQVEAVLTSVAAGRRLVNEIASARDTDFVAVVVMGNLRYQAEIVHLIVDERARKLAAAWQAKGASAPVKADWYVHPKPQAGSAQSTSSTGQ
jgi:hypothetical protein